MRWAEIVALYRLTLSGDFGVVLKNVRVVALCVGELLAHYALLFVKRAAHSWPSLTPTEGYI
jgi:hypothetical protein